ncbi:MAG: hypothetical protein WBG71_04775 [Leeuwenhoekiella sp.]
MAPDFLIENPVFPIHISTSAETLLENLTVISTEVSGEIASC